MWKVGAETGGETVGGWKVPPVEGCTCGRVVESGLRKPQRKKSADGPRWMSMVGGMSLLDADPGGP